MGLFALLQTLFFVSCAESGVAPTDGSYVAYAEDIVVGIELEDGECVGFDMYVKGERFDYYTPADITTKGHYPRYKYQINELTIDARFGDISSFEGILDGVLRTHREDALPDMGEVYSVLAFEYTIPITFVLNNTPLDADGNGFLDNY